MLRRKINHVNTVYFSFVVILFCCPFNHDKMTKRNGRSQPRLVSKMKEIVGLFHYASE